MNEDPRQPPVDPRKYALQLAIGSTAPNASTDDIMNRATRFLEFVLVPAVVLPVEPPKVSVTGTDWPAFITKPAEVQFLGQPTHPLEIAKYTDDQRAAADAVAVAELEHYDAYKAAVRANIQTEYHEYPDFHTEQAVKPPPVRWYDPEADDKRGPDVV